jgi:hypothetical protein
LVAARFWFAMDRSAPARSSLPRAIALLVAGLFWAAAPASAAELPATDSASGKVPLAAKIVRYATRVVAKYDANANGWLEQDEWRLMGGKPQSADGNGDRLITVEEFAQYVANYSQRRRIRLRSPGPEIQFVFPLLQSHHDAVSLRQQDAAPDEPPVTRQPPKPRFHVAPSQLPEGLPKWFVDRDRDGDGQLSLHEFTAQTPRADTSLFQRADANGDGLLTARECMRTKKAQPAQTPSGAEPTATSAGQPGTADDSGDTP